MDIVFVLLPLSLLLAVVALFGYFWGVRRGQFDDLETPAMRVLFDDQDEVGEQAYLVATKLSEPVAGEQGKKGV